MNRTEGVIKQVQKDQALGQLAIAGELAKLARLQEADAKYQEAETSYRKVLTLYERHLGEAHADTGGILNDLGDVCSAQGHYAEADKLYRRSLGILEKAKGAWHPDVAAVLKNLSEVRQAQGEFNEAETLARRALQILETVLREGVEGEKPALDEEDVAAIEWMYQQVITDVAIALRNQGSFAQAEPLLQKALTTAQQIFGSDHPEFASSLNNLGVLYKYWGRYDKAEPLYRRAREILEKNQEKGQLRGCLRTNILILLNKKIKISVVPLFIG
jgi:tetratricopeptide (TPR) repeat protein